MASQWVRRGYLGLLFLMVMLLIVGCGIESPVEPPPTPTPGAHFLMPTPAAPVSPPPYTPAPEMIPYIVQEGDTLYEIALRYEVSIDELIRMNDLSDPNNLSIGQELLIPLPPEPTPSPSP